MYAHLNCSAFSVFLQSCCCRTPCVSPAAVPQKMRSVIAPLLANYVEHHISIFSTNSRDHISSINIPVPELAEKLLFVLLNLTIQLIKVEFYFPKFHSGPKHGRYYIYTHTHTHTHTTWMQRTVHPGTHLCRRLVVINLLKPSGCFTYRQGWHSKILHGARFALSVLYGYQNRQRLLLYTSLTDWFL